MIKKTLTYKSNNIIIIVKVGLLNTNHE